MSVLALIGYLLAVGREGRLLVFPIVVGNLDHRACRAEVDGVDLPVSFNVAGVYIGYLSSFIGYLLAVGRPAKLRVVRRVVGDLDPFSPADVLGVDLIVLSVQPA